MILTVDAGNTHIKVGAWDCEELVFVSRLQTNPLKTQDEYAINFMEVLRLHGCNNAQFDGAIVSCVVPALSQVLTEAVQTVVRSQRVYLVGPGLKTGLNIKIDNPSTLGSDMVCAAVAAIHKYPMPCILISLGTAPAIFALDADGSFLGGAITAGVGLALEALASRTAQLPHISVEEPAQVIGTNTVSSIQSGVVFGTADLLDGMIARMKKQLGEPCGVIACGGLAASIVEHCSNQIQVDDYLVLEGLRQIYHKNAK